MEMQDNEFDELFRSKLDNFEAEPSAGVWDGIAGELNAITRKKYILPFLSIAASIIVLIAAGIIFIPQKVKVNGKHPVQTKLAEAVQPLNITIAKTRSKPSVLKSRKGNKFIKTPVTVYRIARLHHIVVTRYDSSKNSRAIVHQPNSAKSDDRQSLAAVPQIQGGTSKPAVVPDKDTELIAKAFTDERDSFTPEPSVQTTPLPVTNKAAGLPVKPKHKMPTLGDLINVAVARIDKRKDKIIEFTDTDDGDESHITGVNLGIIKIKKGE
jgi:hypothetical protein